MSADATAGRAHRLLRSGAREYLAKPINVTRLLALLDELAAERAAAVGALAPERRSA